MRARRGVPVALLAVLADALVGCGGGEGSSTTGAPAPKLEDRVLVSGANPPVRPADLARPIAEYKRHVAAALAAMEDHVARLGDAVDAGDLAAARRAWLAADASYESIGAAYGAFGELDARIDGETAGLRGGAASPEFTGLHRIELALFGRASTADAAPYVPRLAADVRTLRRKVPGLEIEPLEYVLRGHEVFEGALDLQLTGRAGPWSSDALVALASNLRGTRVVIGTLRPLIDPREPLLMGRIDHRLDALEATLRRLAGADGAMPRWDRLPAAAKTLVAGQTAAAAEELAYVPEVVDPRPLVPERSAIGEVQAE
ncbi:MAG TPA: EfeM/EfeO family lipoprotein [Solirubrobacterales bacterium]|nr:EfeM/EfeO family lipoprotein [Solirubrobacterales bacterium]